LNNSTVPLILPLSLDIDCPEDRVIRLDAPKGVEIISACMEINAANLSGNVFSNAFGATASVKITGSAGYKEIDPSEAMPDKVTSIIIDFHTRRTITGFQLQSYSPAEPDLFLIIRAAAGGSWFLPNPVNLLELAYGPATGTSAKGMSAPTSEGLPQITAEKLMLTFAKLRRANGSGYVTHSTTNGNLYEQGEVIVEEKPLKLVGLSIMGSDFLTDFSIRVGEAPPFFQPEGEFFTSGENYQLPDFTGQLNTYIEDSDPELPSISVPLTIHTEMSGRLDITRIELEYVRHYRWSEETIIFEPDPRRSSTIERSISLDIDPAGSIQFISMKLGGEFSGQCIVPPPDIRPYIMPGVDYTTGFQIIPGKKAAQKIVLSKTFKITGIDLALKFLHKSAEPVGCVLELRNDSRDQPGEKIVVSKKIADDLQTGAEQSPARDFAWVSVDFEEEIQLPPGTYWIVLEGTQGELVWRLGRLAQIARRSIGETTRFLYAYNAEGGGWTTLPESDGEENCAVYRMRRSASSTDDPPLLRVKLNDTVICEKTPDPGPVDILIEEKIDPPALSGPSGGITLAFKSQSSGTLTISGLLVKYWDITGKLLPVTGFIETKK
jgi:hypothetical protein